MFCNYFFKFRVFYAIIPLLFLSSAKSADSHFSHSPGKEGSSHRQMISESSGYASNNSLPPAYRLNWKAIKPLPHLNLDLIDPHHDVPSERLEAWDPARLKEGNFMIVMGLSFLDFTADGFNRTYSGYLQAAENKNDPRPFYLGGFWEALWSSASLVSPKKYPTAGLYGVALEIPPQLILKTYQLDSTTPTHSDLLPREDHDQFVKDYLKWEGGYNAKMYMENDERGVPQIKSKRIFAEGESPDSHPFMTPEEMIQRGRPNEHNEIKFVPRASYKGKEYSAKIIGIWYKDKPSQSQLSAPASPDLVEKLKMVADELGVPLIPLSQSDLVVTPIAETIKRIKEQEKEEQPQLHGEALSQPATAPQEEIDTVNGQKYIVPLPFSRTPQKLDPHAVSAALLAKKKGEWGQVFLTTDHDWVLDFSKQGSGWQFDIDHALQVLSKDGAQVTRRVAGRFHEGMDSIHYLIHSPYPTSPANDATDMAAHMQQSVYEVIFKKVKH